jgi:hypothetical protein
MPIFKYLLIITHIKIVADSSLHTKPEDSHSTQIIEDSTTNSKLEFVDESVGFIS